MLHIYLFANNSKSLNFYQVYKDSLFPQDLMNKYGFMRYEIHFFDSSSIGCIETFLRGQLFKDSVYIENIIFLHENHLNLDIYKYAFFVAKICNSKNNHNDLKRQISLFLKRFNLLNKNFQDATLIELMRLPLKNFKSSEFEEFLGVTKDIAIEGVDVDSFQDSLKHLLNSRKPRKRPHSKEKYYVDERFYHFRLGDERHSRHGTGEPHNFLCDLNARYRFGCKIDELRHFNVMKDGKDTLICGKFINCHNGDVNFTDRTHLNMFSNDFIE